MPKRILFVDDEPAVLDGLRDLMRKMRKQWEMSFALGGAAALAELRRTRFDVVVSDMRMPGMDGAELLRRVRDEHPGVARIVLSGQADQEMVSRVLPVAQQYLSKPCEAGQLQETIERVCQLRTMAGDQAVRDLVGTVDKLPSVPETYWTLTRAISDPSSRTDDIARIVAVDPAMSAKVLQLVNSAYFGLSRPVSSVAQATTYLGLDLLKGLALTLNVFAAGEKLQSLPGLSFDEVQRTALLTARLAKQFAIEVADAEPAFTAGLVHDIGKLILLLRVPHLLMHVHQLSGESRRPEIEVEREVLGSTHAEVGAYLLGVWGLPLDIVEAVAYHHEVPPERTEKLGVLVAVYAADALGHEALDAAAGREGPPRLDPTWLESVGMARHLPGWRAVAQREVVGLAQRTRRATEGP